MPDVSRRRWDAPCTRARLCPHDEDGRILNGTWCTPELEEAQLQGYRIAKVHEVWHFAERREGLFALYVDRWLKVKTEASGFAHWANTVEEKLRYVANYREREGIQLDVEMIEKNPGRKATAKLMLNSFWGKFGENLRKSSTRQITHPSELVTDPLKVVTSLRCIGGRLYHSRRRMCGKW